MIKELSLLFSVGTVAIYSTTLNLHNPCRVSRTKTSRGSEGSLFLVFIKLTLFMVFVMDDENKDIR